MSLATSTPIEYSLFSATSDEQSHQVLEVRLRYLRRLFYVSPSAGVGLQIVDETAATALKMKNAVFDLCLSQLQDPLSYVTQLLYSFNIRAAACEVIARDIIQMACGNRDQTNFHIVAEVDYIRLAWMEPTPAPALGRSNGDGALVVLEQDLDTAASVWMNQIPILRRRT